VLAAHDDGRLLDQRQSVLDPVGDRRPERRQQGLGPEDGVVACGKRHERGRLPRCIA
jgi:hypothetical protein